MKLYVILLGVSVLTLSLKTHFLLDLLNQVTVPSSKILIACKSGTLFTLSDTAKVLPVIAGFDRPFVKTVAQKHFLAFVNTPQDLEQFQEGHNLVVLLDSNCSNYPDLLHSVC